ncbi:MAG: domain/HD domain protein [Frankiales bacterium]|nr:domain/HD domain protein [Frankiales bacterium]
MTAPTGTRWQARPVLAAALRLGLLAVPFAASWGAISLVRGVLTPGSSGTWWGLLALLGVGLVVALGVERGARRLLPVALLLRLSTVFPDQAPSRLVLARAAVARSPRPAPVGEAATSTDLVLALVQALGTHDRRTRGHCERVRVLTDVLATEVGLDTGARERLRWAALLHDLGKVEVPTRILNKPGRLDEAETARVRLHPAAGAALARPLLGWLGAEGEGIVDHHEKYDGSGYPAGKARDEISPAGRLIGLVDAFETMTAARPYKKAMATRAAREELARCAGTHFDPVYVKAFLAVSLPRVLWAMGPLSFVLQLPFLRSLAEAGARTAALAPGAASSLGTGALGAAGAGLLVAGGLGGGGTAVHSVPAPAALAQPVDDRVPAGIVAPAVRGSGSPSPTPSSPAPSPASPSASPARRGAPAVSPSPDPPASPSAPAATTAPFPRPAASSAPSSTPGSPAGTGAPAARPLPSPTPSPSHPALLSGPPPSTPDRTATFSLADGGPFDCQLQGAADGGSSAWRPCTGTFTLEVLRDGDQVLRVRDAATHALLDTWTWTVVPPQDGR